jgi:hypothetical protein
MPRPLTNVVRNPFDGLGLTQRECAASKEKPRRPCSKASVVENRVAVGVAEGVIRDTGMIAEEGREGESMVGSDSRRTEREESCAPAVALMPVEMIAAPCDWFMALCGGLFVPEIVRQSVERVRVQLIVDFVRRDAIFHRLGNVNDALGRNPGRLPVGEARLTVRFAGNF